MCLFKSIAHVQEFADFAFFARFGEARGNFHEDSFRNEAIQECHDNIKFLNSPLLVCYKC